MTGIAQGTVDGLFSDIAANFGQAASSMLGQLGHIFIQASTVDLGRAGLGSLTRITLPIAAVVAAACIVLSMATTAWRQNGSAVATSMIGLGRATIITASLLAVTQLGLAAADQLSTVIVIRTFGSDQRLASRLGEAMGAAGGLDPALLLIAAAVAIVLSLLLWAEMLFRHVAIVVLVASAPIAAAGLTLRATESWWPRLRAALIQLIVLKPLVVFCLAVGFGLSGSAGDLNGLIAGLITLGLAVFAWPMLARFMTFTSVGAGSGLASAALGGAAGLAAGHGRSWVTGSRPNPGALSGPAYAVGLERQNEGLMSGLPGEMGGTGALAGVSPGTATAGPLRAGAGAASGPCAAVVAAARGTQLAARTVTGAVEGMAAHAGLHTGSSDGRMALPDARPLGEQA